MQTDGEVETVTIPLELYNELVEDQRFLQALNAAGVDNWEGFEHAQDILREEN